MKGFNHVRSAFKGTHEVRAGLLLYERNAASCAFRDESQALVWWEVAWMRVCAHQNQLCNLLTLGQALCHFQSQSATEGGNHKRM